MPNLSTDDGVVGIVNTPRGFQARIVVSALAPDSLAKVITSEEFTVPIDFFLASRFKSVSG